MFNISRYAISHRTIIRFLLAVMLLGGVYAFIYLGKREDSTFTIKSAVVTASYPGATPDEVEAYLTEPLERELRTLSSVYKITSESHFGYSRLVVELHPATPSRRIAQLWDELRRKIENVSALLPEGVGDISVADDYGDVYGLYYALISDGGYSWDELRSSAQSIVSKLYTVSGVEKAILCGEQSPEINIVIAPSKLAAFDLTPEDVAAAIAEQGAVVGSGIRQAGDIDIIILEGSVYDSIEDIENLLLFASDGKQYRLGDVADISKGYKEPSSVIFKVDGRNAIGIAVASDPEMDIVAVGDAVDRVLSEAEYTLPLGISIVSLYPENLIAKRANYDFLLNLVESLVIVVILIMLFMGIRAGIIVGSSLLFAIGGTLLIMYLFGVTLNRTSLAGFIIAMGMLVDNAIVVEDNIEGAMRRGVPLVKAAVSGATQPRWALLSATLIAIISFLPLQLAPTSVAEIIRPLFVVISVSLLLSWLLAITQVPEMSVSLLRSVSLRSSLSRRVWFERLVAMLLSHRLLTLCVVIALFVLSLWTMSRMPQNFFPQLSKAYFRADMLLPEGYDIASTQKELDRMTGWLLQQPEVKRVSSVAGATPPRYYLASSSYADRPNYGNLLVELYSPKSTANVEQHFDEWVVANMPDVWLRSSLFKLSPVPDATIEIGFIGDDIDTLKRLTAQAMDIMSRNGLTRNVRNSWTNRVAVWQPHYSQIKGQRIGVTRGSLLRSLDIAVSGLRVASYREGDISMPVLLRSQPSADSSLMAVETMPVFSRSGKGYSIEQASSGFEFSFENSVIKRINSERVMMAQCDPKRGVNTLQLLDELMADLSSEVVLPEGYRMQPYGEEQSREESNEALMSKLPITLLLIFVLLLLLFGNYRDPLIVLLTIPFIFLGVVLGLSLTGKMFDFFSLLGLLGLVGMNVKNGVILISRITELRGKGVAPAEAVVRAASDRFVPVVAASATTVLALIPLLFDSMFGSMAATIMGGLVVATLLVLMILPVVYSLFYRIKL
ncbi:MAG: efflux RND transporter permease subunit [Alistipes sp.]|nr:efflux RND transporter permease subunit [Alistipes sp.]